MTLVDYAGAAGRIEVVASSRSIGIRRAKQLGRLGRWVLQPKVDGCYAELHLDRHGRLYRALKRSGEPFGLGVLGWPENSPAAPAPSGELVGGAGGGQAGSLIGARLGWPFAVLVGELEAYTEWSARAVLARGYVQVHLYDIVRGDQGRYVGREPYRARRDLLWRMQSEIVNLAPEVPWIRDGEGDAHSRLTGRYVEGHPTDWRLAPIVPQVPIARIDEAWERWGPDADGEGLVAVNLDAPLGARGSKKKIKRTDEIECVVVSVGAKAARLDWRGHMFAVSNRGDMPLTVGEIVSVAHEGWQEQSVRPRFARLVRRRPDLVPSAA